MAKAALIILDGYGLAPPGRTNPQTEAVIPNLKRLEKEAFSAVLQASSIAVGLPWGEPGNSETGHMTIGAGRLLYHSLPRIIMDVRKGTFFSNPALKGAFQHVRKTKGTLHVMGLVSSGSVHAYIDHLYALMEMAQREGVPFFLHVFTDGRDAEPREAGKFLPQVDERMQKMGVGRIATVCGRHFAMDRDGHWDRTEQAYRLLTQNEGEHTLSLSDAFAAYYAEDVTDEYIPPTVVVSTKEGRPPRVRSGDALIFLNFREDSARQLASAFGADDFPHFAREELERFRLVTFTQYVAGLRADVAFPPIAIHDTLGETLSHAGLSQLRIAETEKYAHVTYFFNGGAEEAFPGEERQLVPSYSDVSADERPEMRASEIARYVAEAMERGTPDVIIANFANADMVGHTGNFAACRRALGALDEALGRILNVASHKDVPVFVTADHGNIEEKLDVRTGRPLTEHTVNPVPFFAFGPGLKPREGQEHLALYERQASGLLTDIAPTFLRVLKVPKPQAMSGQSLW